MFKTLLFKLSNCLPSKSKRRHKEKALDTLAAFTSDFEHDFIAVSTVIQAHVDLLHEDQTNKDSSFSRNPVLNRNLDRLVKNTKSLGVIANLANLSPVKEKVLLKTLLQSVIKETLSEFDDKKMVLAFKDSQDATLIGDSDSLKHMVTKIVLVVLHMNQVLDKVTIILESTSKNISMKIESGPKQDEKQNFKRWQLGKLHLIPTNGDGIFLSVVDAIARLHSGNLSVSTALNENKTFQLNFQR